jgi:hypothetical protein
MHLKPHLLRIEQIPAAGFQGFVDEDTGEGFRCGGHGQTSEFDECRKYSENEGAGQTGAAPTLTLPRSDAQAARRFADTGKASNRRGNATPPLSNAFVFCSTGEAGRG